ncbi:hypothetical protein M9Y10_015017 [Tritrichomonas musculus]|uniref:Uncharacterized protein n=1 Tax=Tritrichomonas musculus TaxID=1915356 RepID=A0ABR2L160_9EUKA
MNFRLPPRALKPPRVIHVTKGSEALTPQPKGAPFSPLMFFQRNSQSSPSYNSTSLVPRAPIVHFFVCDHGNAKVKALAEQFIKILTENGIDVFVEEFPIHQPGYQVRAASLSTFADFFFQIHSKTAGPGHVRLYEGGQPNRMTTTEAVAKIWSMWRSKCGALSPEEVGILSKDCLMFLLKEFANIVPQNLDIASLQSQARESIENGISVKPIVDKLHEFEVVLNDGKAQILTSKTMSYEWKKEPGKVLDRVNPQPTTTRGLSQPLKEILIEVIKQTFQKVKAIIDVLEKYYSPSQSTSQGGPNFNSIGESTIGSDQKTRDGSSWKLLIESADEDRVGSMRIPSYGDGNPLSESMNTPVLLLDDY